MRISETVNGVTTRYVVDPTSSDYQALEELNAAGGVTASYTYGLDRISAVLPGTSTETYYVGNALGSVGALTSSSGTDVGNYTYDAFGQVLTSPTNSTNPFSFAGERIDPITGLVDLRARQYDPATGRFVSQDPDGYENGINLYTYAANDPINQNDPTGQVPLLVAAVGIGALTGGIFGAYSAYQKQQTFRKSTYTGFWKGTVQGAAATAATIGAAVLLKNPVAALELGGTASNLVVSSLSAGAGAATGEVAGLGFSAAVGQQPDVNYWAVPLAMLTGPIGSLAGPTTGRLPYWLAPQTYQAIPLIPFNF